MPAAAYGPFPAVPTQEVHPMDPSDVGGAAAIWAVDYANAGVSGHPMWDSVQLGRLE